MSCMRQVKSNRLLVASLLLHTAPLCCYGEVLAVYVVRRPARRGSVPQLDLYVSRDTTGKCSNIAAQFSSRAPSVHNVHKTSLASRSTTGLFSQSSSSRLAVPTIPAAFVAQRRLLSTSQDTLLNVPELSHSVTPSTAEFLANTVNGTQHLASTQAGQNVLDIGFLREAGLDFGWGPASMMQSLFEYVHIYGGTPFWGTIVISAFVVRAFVFPLIIQASETGARLAAVRPVLQPLQEKMKAAAAAKDTRAMQAARQEAKEVYSATGIKLWKMALPFLQIPLGFGSWRVLRNMAEAGVPGMTTGGFLWLPNLTIPDPYFITPFVCAAFQHLSMRVSVNRSLASSPSTI